MAPSYYFACLFVQCCQRTRFDMHFVSDFSIFSIFAKIGHDLEPNRVLERHGFIVKGYRVRGGHTKRGAPQLRHPVTICFQQELIVNVEALPDVLVGTEERYRVAFFEKEVSREFQDDFSVSLN